MDTSTFLELVKGCMTAVKEEVEEVEEVSERLGQETLDE